MLGAHLWVQRQHGRIATDKTLQVLSAEAQTRQVCPLDVGRHAERSGEAHGQSQQHKEQM